jgi:hypothetical protein
MMPKFLRSFICVCIAVSFLNSAHAVLRPVEKIVATGDTLPAGEGTPLFFETLQTGMINNNGEVAFQGNIDNPVGDLIYKNGIWVKSNGTFEERVRAGEVAPGADPGVTPKFTGFLGPTLNDAGVVGYLAYTDVNVHRAGYWISDSGNTSVIGVQGSSVTGLAADYSGIFYTPSLNNSGQLAFNAGIQRHDESIHRYGIFISDTNQTDVVTLQYESAPGTEGNFAGIARTFPPINSQGETAVGVGIVDANSGQSMGTAVYKGNGANLQLVARSGENAPGTNAQFNSVGLPSTPLNSLSETVFRGSLQGPSVSTLNDGGLWRTRNANAELLAREGDPIPGSNDLFFGNFISAVIDDSDQVVFKASLTPGTQTSLWSARDGELSLLARPGMPAPGTGGTFSNLTGFGNFASNTHGQVAFQAVADGTTGIWAQDPSGALRLIIRTGDSVEVSPGDVRTIASFEVLYLSGGSDGKSRSFNDAGQLVFNATFVGGGEGIFVSDVAGYYLADFDRDGDVDTDDLDDWRSAYTAGTAGGDADGDGVSSGRDFLIWQRQMGLGTVGEITATEVTSPVPEPASAVLLVIGCLALGNRRRTGCIRASFRCNTRGKQRG